MLYNVLASANNYPPATFFVFLFRALNRAQAFWAPLGSLQILTFEVLSRVRCGIIRIQRKRFHKAYLSSCYMSPCRAGPGRPSTAMVNEIPVELNEPQRALKAQRDNVNEPSTRSLLMSTRPQRALKAQRDNVNEPSTSPQVELNETSTSPQGSTK